MQPSKQRLHEISRILDGHSKEPDSHIAWVSGGGDEAIDLCSTCAEMKVKALNRRARRVWEKAGRKGGWDQPYYVGGGYCHRESDGSAVCDCCGENLTYTLTEYGVGEELEYFSDIADGWDEKPSPEAVYQVERVISAAAYSDDEDIVALALTIGEATIAALNAEDSRHAA